MKNTNPKKPEIDLNMIVYDKDKDKWRCQFCGKDFILQVDAVRHLSKKHCKKITDKLGG